MLAAHNAQPSSAPAPSLAVKHAQQAVGGGPGRLWVNTFTNVYHGSTDRYDGKTKQGAYMIEADAKAQGAEPDRGKGCSYPQSCNVWPLPTPIRQAVHRGGVPAGHLPEIHAAAGLPFGRDTSA